MLVERAELFVGRLRGYFGSKSLVVSDVWSGSLLGFDDLEMICLT